MAYQVVKTIKGKQYLYQQETYRDGDRVRTKSRYLGALDPQTGGIVADSRLKNSAISVSVTESLESTNPEPSINSPKPQDTPSESELTLQNTPLEIRADLSIHKISQAALEAEHQQFNEHLSRKGLNTSQMPSVVVREGSQLAATLKGNQYEVTVPGKAQKGIRAEFWRTYRKNQARAYLDAIEAQDPKYFEGLEQHLSEAYRRQNRAIASYIMYSKRKEVFKLGLTLHFLYSKMVSAWTQAHLAPEKIGLADYGDRRHWKADAAALMADVQREGWRPCYQKYTDALKHVETQCFYAVQEYQAMGFVDRLSGKHRSKRQEIRKLNARRRAIYATCDKLSVLAPLYQGYKGQIHGSDPFLHERNWTRVKARWRAQLRRSATGK